MPKRWAASMLACALLVAVPVRAQEEPSQALGFDFAAGLASVRDDLLVPRAHTGLRLALGPRYAAMLGPGSLHAELHVAAAYILDRDSYPGVAFDHAIDVQYVFDLPASGRLHHALGPALGVDTDVLGLISWDDAHAYWIATRWLGAAWRGVTPGWPGWRWSVFAELPLVGLSSRPESYRHNKQDGMNHLSFYFFDVQADPEPVWLPQWQQLRASVNLWHTASSSLVLSGWAIGAEARIVHAADPKSAFAFRTTVRVSAAWGL